MARAQEQLINMIETVARALGSDLLSEVVFVGGCTTGLLVSDEVTKEGIRFTDDVDLIVNVAGYTGWHSFQEQLKEKGFTVSLDDEVICRMRLNGLMVDFMPDDQDILGFSNRWYRQAHESAQDYRLAEDLVIRLLTPPFFIATKLEAFKGRGNNDPLASHDIEDLLNLFDGRPELVREIQAEDRLLRDYIAEEIGRLLKHDLIDYAIQGVVMGDRGRVNLVFERLEAIDGLKESS